MSKSLHNNWLLSIDQKYRIFRRVGERYDVLEYTRYDYSPIITDKVSKLIREHLTDELISSSFREKYPADHDRWKYPYFGLCVPATFVLLYLMDTNVLEPMTAKDATGEPHYWLRDILTRERYDLTLDQFASYNELEDLYDRGKPAGYYGGRKPNYQMPASRFLDLIQKVQPTSKRWKAMDYNSTPEPPPSLERFMKD